MAVLDPRDNSVVIRVVYDGTPMAGKTTSVGALGRSLGGTVHSPVELEGRTLYFDWLEYTGGWFDGHQVRCQIVSVPGQTELTARRRRLLESADVVVFVGNSSNEGLTEDAAYLRQLQELLLARGHPPVGIVLQANKRDLPQAVPLDQVRGLLESLGLRIAVVESVATAGTGIREAFVLAVRLALDRVREQMSEGTLPVLAPSIDSAEDLLKDLQQNEHGTPPVTFVPSAAGQQVMPADALAAVALREAVNETPAPRHARAGFPAPPDANVASGLIWPPVDGRVILHEITAASPELLPLENGGWSGLVGRWRFQTEGSQRFATLDEGRGALVEWARSHSECREILSRDRCIVLADDGGGSFRLWQIVKTHPTLHEQFQRALHDSAEALAAALLLLVRSFLRIASQLSSLPCALPLSVDRVGVTDLGPCYVGIAPVALGAVAARTWSPAEASDVLAAELQSYRATLHERRIELLAALAQQVRVSGLLNRSEWALMQRVILLRNDGLPPDSQRRSA